MDKAKEDLESLRLLKAFFTIKDPIVRREVINFVESRSTTFKSTKKLLDDPE